MSERASQRKLDVGKLKKSLQHEYSVTAARYDARRSVSSRVLGYFERSYATVDLLIGPTSAQTIHLDLPVGTGRFVRYLRAHGRTHRIIGVDVAPGMLEEARRACASDPATSICFGDAFALQLPDASVDVLTSLRFFHLFPRQLWPAILAEMHRVLVPGGLLILDLRNALRGLAWAMIKEYRDRWLHDDRPHSFIAPHQVAGVFARWTGLRSRGVGLDGVHWMTALAPGLASRLEDIAGTSALRHLTKELVVAVRKP